MARSAAVAAGLVELEPARVGEGLLDDAPRPVVAEVVVGGRPSQGLGLPPVAADARPARQLQRQGRRCSRWRWPTTRLRLRELLLPRHVALVVLREHTAPVRDEPGHEHHRAAAQIAPHPKRRVCRARIQAFRLR